jgi:hypothetical protein
VLSDPFVFLDVGAGKCAKRKSLRAFDQAIKLGPDRPSTGNLCDSQRCDRHGPSLVSHHRGSIRRLVVCLWRNLNRLCWRIRCVLAGTTNGLAHA